MTIENVKAIQTLKNGVKVFDLADMVEEDFSEAQNIIDYGVHDYIDTESAYRYRVNHESFVGVYQVSIESKREYTRFIELMREEELACAHPTFEQWQENKITDEHSRTAKLGKYLKKHGASESLRDFYSAQLRSGKETMYITISDLPQHIAGMTYYASNWRSCQHPDSYESIHLAGSLHDDTLLVGMLHKDMEDLEDMDGNLLARVVMRIVRDEEDRLHLVPSRVYGKDTNQRKFNEGLRQLAELNIHSRDIRFIVGQDNYEDELELRMEANGSYELHTTDIVWIEQMIEQEVECDCPMCEGDGKYEVWSDRFDKDVKIDCPLCNGSGEYVAYVMAEVEEEIEIEDNAEILPYTDDYYHGGRYVNIKVNAERLKEHNATWNKERVEG